MDSHAFAAEVSADLNRLQEQLNELHQRRVIVASSEEKDTKAGGYDAEMVIRGR